MKKQTIDDFAKKPKGSYKKFVKANPDPDLISEHEYPRIHKLGLTIVTKCPNSIPGINGEELAQKLGKKKTKIFSDLFGCQTCGGNGMYVYDVEAVLERMASGKLQGTQKFWD
jgi:hypothetical protein